MAELAYAEEMEVIKKSDLTIVVSESEVAALEDEATAPVASLVTFMISTTVRASSMVALTCCLWVGFSIRPTSMQLSTSEMAIWPHFKAACPEAEALIIGSRMPETLKRWGEERGLKMIGL